MVWTKIRVDFTEPVKCQFCDRTISSGKGILIQNQNGEFSFSGPSCAKNKNGNNVTNPAEKIIDVTKGCSLYEKISTSIPSTKGGNQGNNVEKESEENNYYDEKSIKAYLTLRFEKLSHLLSLFSSKKLDQIYLTYKQSDRISPKDEGYLKTIMYGELYPLFTYKNLQAVYAAEYWISYFIRNSSVEDLSFMLNVQEQLRNKLTLTKKQIQAINNWFSNMPSRFVRLKLDAFAI